MLKVTVLSISLVILSAFAIAGILPEIQQSLGLTQTQADLLLTIPSIAILLAVLASNVVVNRIGMKKTVIAGLFIVGVAGSFPIVNPAYVPLLVSRFALGVGLGLFNPLAVSYISFLFAEKEVPSLMGFRSAVEAVGLGVFSFISGLLLYLGWHVSFSIYSTAFILLIIFLAKVPDVALEDEQKKVEDIEQNDDKMNPLVLPIVIFSAVIVVCGAAVGVRFPSLAAEIRGEGYNSSTVLAIQPLVNIFVALVFGKFHHILGRKLLYIGIFAVIIAHLLIGFSNGNYPMIVVALFLHGLIPAWIGPFIFNMIARLTSGKQQNLAISLVMVGFNLGMFTFPFIIGFFEDLIGSTSLTDIYPFLAVFTAGMLVVIMLLGNKISKVSTNQQAIN